MTELSQKILRDYQVRKTRKQKDAFISLIKEHYPETVVESSGIIKSHNLIIGDINSAKTVLTAHYDTCARLPFPNFIAPKNIPISLLYSLLLIIPMAIILFALNYPISRLTTSFWVHYWFTLAAAIILMALMVTGPANKKNANDNTSGVILLLEVLSQLTVEQRKETAIVFFDNEEIGLLGSSQFKKKYAQQMESKLLINFDCVSDGDHILIAENKAAKEKYGELLESTFVSTETKEISFCRSEKVFYPSDHIGFPNAVAVAAFHKKKFIGHYIGRIHTGRDTVFDECNIELLTTYCTQYLEKANENIPVK